MATFELTEQNFEETLKKGGILFIDFWAAWCGPCKAFGPVFEQASNTHGDITFAKVDTEAQRGLAQAFEIQAIPTLAVFRDGVLVGQNAGALPGSALEQVIQQVRELDMEQVKAEVAKRSSSAGGDRA
jgi:thioredoxin 1